MTIQGSVKYLILFLASIFFHVNSAYCQTQVAITIDDVPNIRKYQKDNFDSILLNKLDSLSIPVAIFINEGQIYKNDSVVKNIELLQNWIKRDYITAGNHSFSHSRYSEVGLELFIEDINKGESYSKELSSKYNKSIKYFRFPYNDLGKDSIQQKQIQNYLTKKEYIITPFTIESSDWMFNYVYEYYLKTGNIKKAAEIGMLYVDKTMQTFDFFNSLAINQYGRAINQIYLCHDNSLNADYLNDIIKLLKEKEYTFISLDEAILDSVYQQKINYWKKWGVSWLYRWMDDKKERKRVMQQEPHMDAIYKLYESLK